MSLQPSTPIQYLKGVGPRLAELFEKRSVYTAWDMLFYLPIKYVDRRKIFSIRELKYGEKQAVVAKVVSHQVVPLKGRSRKIFEIGLEDGTGQLKASFFQFNEKWLRKKFPLDESVLLFGEVKPYRGTKTIVHPEMESWDDSEQGNRGIQPFYALTEGLHQKTVQKIFKNNLEQLLTLVEDDPYSVRDSGEVQISLKQAFQYVHEPPLDAEIEELNERRSPFHQRLIYDEFFYLQLGLLSKKYHQSARPSLKMDQGRKLYEKALNSLPFELTGAQSRAIDDIHKDFLKGQPMNRMIQGDVGSGKTIVSFLTALMAIEAGYQVALMAPTEILAEQHYKNLFPYEEALGVKIDLLTGSTKTKQRNLVLYNLEQGQTQLLIGTHALLTPDVHFANLGYVIIDEQHRFGVAQRAQLKNKTKSQDGELVPHVLIMTATPIPRTLSMCVYGDLSLSLINERPKGRKPIQTKVYREKQRATLNQFLLKELQAGRQVYFVCPLVEESETLDLKNASLMSEQIAKDLLPFKVGLLHGRMKSNEKETIMTSFKRRDLHVLVSTTVIEVGVDVPNASVMVIENAERFGLSQLHQLRGRVGRGADQAYCFLMASYKQSEESRFRLKVMEETDDGFVIAEEDLKLRGPGEFLGTKQSGMPDFRLAQIVRDDHLLRAAQARAEAILQKDPFLETESHQKIKKIMMERWGKRLDLSLV